MLLKNKSKIAIILLAMIISMIFGIFTTTIDSHAEGIWSDNTLNVTGNGKVTQGGKTKNGYATIITKYKTLITFVSGIGAITMVGIFIFHFIKLGSTAANPQERSRCTPALIWSGLAAAGLGSVALIVGVFYGMLAGK